MSEPKAADDTVVTAQLVRRGYKVPWWLGIGMWIVTVVAFATTIWSMWPQFPWSAVAQQNRAKMKALHGTIRPGDPFQATLDQLSTLPGYDVRDDRKSPIRDFLGLKAKKEAGNLDFATVEALPREILLSDLRLHIAAVDNTIVGIGLRMRGERRVQMDDCPPDQVDPKFIDEWERVVGYYP